LKKVRKEIYFIHRLQNIAIILKQQWFNWHLNNLNISINY